MPPPTSNGGGFRFYAFRRLRVSRLPRPCFPQGANPSRPPRSPMLRLPLILRRPRPGLHPLHRPNPRHPPHPPEPRRPNPRPPSMGNHRPSRPGPPSRRRRMESPLPDSPSLARLTFPLSFFPIFARARSPRFCRRTDSPRTERVGARDSLPVTSTEDRHRWGLKTAKSRPTNPRLSCRPTDPAGVWCSEPGSRRPLP